MNGTTEHPIFYWHDSPGNTFRVDVGDADEAAECPHCVPVYSAETVDRLRARVAELEAADGICFTAMLVEIDGHAYGLRPGAARIVREALRDAGRIDWIARMSKTSTVYMDNQHPWNVAGNYRFNNLRGQTFRDAIDAAMAKDGA